MPPANPPAQHASQDPTRIKTPSPHACFVLKAPPKSSTASLHANPAPQVNFNPTTTCSHASRVPPAPINHKLPRAPAWPVVQEATNPPRASSPVLLAAPAPTNPLPVHPRVSSVLLATIRIKQPKAHARTVELACTLQEQGCFMRSFVLSAVQAALPMSQDLQHVSSALPLPIRASDARPSALHAPSAATTPALAGRNLPKPHRAVRLRGMLGRLVSTQRHPDFLPSLHPRHLPGPARPGGL